MEWIVLPGCRAEGVRRVGSTALVISARSRRGHAACPKCRHGSTTVHGHYRRRPADLPMFGREVRLDLRLRRFRCLNGACPRRTFSERLPALVAPRSRRTLRLARAQARVGIALGGEAGCRLARHLGIQASPDTLLRLVRGMPVPSRRGARMIGVDDWAMKKGRRYGTIVVDLERRRIVDLLPDRTAAIQVADRWHLLHNTRQMVERWAAGAHARLRRLPQTAGAGPAGVGRTKAFLRARSDAVIAADSRARREAAYDDVRRRFLAGGKLLAIARATGLARGTVRKYAYADAFPERAARVPPPSIVDPFVPHLENRLAEGCENGASLWREARALGYPGTAKQIRRWLQERRTKPAKQTPRRWRDVTMPPPIASMAAPALPSPKRLAWIIVRVPDTRSALEAAAAARIEQDPEAAVVARLVRGFVDLVRDAGVGGRPHGGDPVARFDAWVRDARTCGVRAVEGFAIGLDLDGAAVRAALSTPWSNAQAEGQITKLKLLKRSMYGRAGHDLLRRRLMLAA